MPFLSNISSFLFSLFLGPHNLPLEPENKQRGLLSEVLTFLMLDPDLTEYGQTFSYFSLNLLFS
jgi:hypothetical protein